MGTGSHHCSLKIMNTNCKLVNCFGYYIVDWTKAIFLAVKAVLSLDYYGHKCTYKSDVQKSHTI